MVYLFSLFKPITFPSHWSLVTGLYPEAHGIVGNYFYDLNLNDSFYYKSPDQSWDSKWWGGEPVSIDHLSNLLFTNNRCYRYGLRPCDKKRNLVLLCGLVAVLNLMDFVQLIPLHLMTILNLMIK